VVVVVVVVVVVRNGFSHHNSSLATGKNDYARRAVHREAVFGTVIYSIFDAWHYKVLWTCALLDCYDTHAIMCA